MWHHMYGHTHRLRGRSERGSQGLKWRMFALTSWRRSAECAPRLSRLRGFDARVTASCVRNFTFLPYFCQMKPRHILRYDPVSTPTITNVTSLSLLEKICCKSQWMKTLTIRSQKSGQSQTLKVRLFLFPQLSLYCHLKPFTLIIGENGNTTFYTAIYDIFLW